MAIPERRLREPTRRGAPAPSDIGRRGNVLISMSEPRPPTSVEASLESGNSKTGSSGRHFAWVRVWNLPPIRTCPGASSWCRSWCYNGQERPEVYREDQWWANLGAFMDDPVRLAALLKNQMSTLQRTGNGALRIHSSGDFFSTAYINMWADIISTHPSVTFWAYTRSWATPELRGSLERLHPLSNLQLFASWDLSMPSPFSRLEE